MILLAILVFAVAWVGHAALWLVALNILYGRPIHRDILSRIRPIVGLIVFGFPLAIAGFLTWGIIEFESSGIRAPLVLEAYLAICLMMSLVAIPIATVARHLRRTPRHFIESRSEVVDSVKLLGRRPIGDGKRRSLTSLPGNQSFQIEFAELTLRLPSMPAAWDGMTILHLTDLHLTGTPERAFYEMAFERCMAAGTPDILAITGDLIDTETHHRWLLPLFSKLRWNIAAFAILGNHDYWHRPDRVRRRLERLGITVLANSWREVTVRGEPMTVVGHEGPWFRPGPDLSDCPEYGFRLCLSHSPDNIRWARRNRIDLMLSGHNHGGQIRLPIFGSLFVPSAYSRRYDCGLFWEEPTLLYVGRGLGGKEPIRYNCRPEITRLVLKSGT
jgi:predicted MPP superfamily phosphohydrolase